MTSIAKPRPAANRQTPLSRETAAIYIRMSTDDQPDSPARQLSQTLPLCESRGYRIHDRYTDLAMRGWDDNRPEFRRLLADAKAGHFQVIVVDEQSRLSRNDPLDFLANVMWPLKQAAVRLETVARGPVSWDDLGGLILATVDQHAARKESVTLSRRVTTQMARLALQGANLGGRPPLGYDRDWHQTPEAELVRSIFRMYTEQDYSLRTIAAKLAETTGRIWTATTIRRILTHPAYIGTYVRGRRHSGRFHSEQHDNGAPIAAPAATGYTAPQDWLTLPNHHEPIIDRDTFAKAAQLLQRNAARRSPSAARQSHVLAQLLRCSHCGAMLVGRNARYICGSYQRSGPAACSAYSVSEFDILTLLKGALKTHFLAPDRLEAIRAEARRQLESAEAHNALPAIRCQTVKLDAQIQRATSNIVLLDPDLIPGAQRQLREWQAQRTELQAEARRLEQSNPVRDTEATIAQFADTLSRIEQAITADDRDALRAALRSIFTRIDLSFTSRKCTIKSRHSLAQATATLYTGETANLVG